MFVLFRNANWEENFGKRVRPVEKVPSLISLVSLSQHNPWAFFSGSGSQLPTAALPATFKAKRLRSFLLHLLPKCQPMWSGPPFWRPTVNGCGSSSDNDRGVASSLLARRGLEPSSRLGCCPGCRGWPSDDLSNKIQVKAVPSQIFGLYKNQQKQCSKRM